jgi:hypothetical protein
VIAQHQQPLSTVDDVSKVASADTATYWYEAIDHNGQSPFIPNGATWKVFRNVVADYGADNTGVQDATNAITQAIIGMFLAAFEDTD